MLVGNKCDMTDEKMIEAEQGADLAKEFGMQFFETSAKTGLNVQEAFIYLAQKVKEKREKMALLNPPVQETNEVINIQATPKKGSKEKKKGCC